MESIPMIYRVFLLDEKEAPNPLANPENYFRIRYGEKSAWYLNCPPEWKPSLDEQLKTMNFGTRVGPRSETLDGHWIIEHEKYAIGIVHDPEEIADRAYELARETAENLADQLSRQKDRTYVFIDLTSRGDMRKAERLSTIVHKTEYVPRGPALCVGIGN